jgi:AAA family ATP:ADP antiporter
MLKELVINRRFLVLFSLMFSIVCLLNVNYCLLRGARNALVVTDLGQGASSIPLFELCGTMPGAVLMVFILTKLLNRFSIHKVFLITLAVFSGFFLFFAIGIYPSLHLWKETIADWLWLPGHDWISVAIPQGFSMLFFVMSELWKIALLTVLFWGLVNQYIPIEGAKRFYGPLMLGGSVGTMLSSPLITLCTSDMASGGSWSRSLTLMMLSLSILGVITAWLYTQLWMQFAGPKVEKKEESLSLLDSIRLCLKSRYLSLLAWITIADYIAYALGEVIFLDVLKQRYPDPRQYCDYQGKLAFWSGLLTAFSALIVTPFLLKKCRWVVASLVTPLCLLITESAFFFVLWTPSKELHLEFLVLLGTIFFCVVRAAKFTLFDTSKEISFLLLPPLEKMQGKLVIDGMCSRMGRGGASLLSILLIQLCGGVMASVFVAGWLALAISASCAFSTFKLGLIVDRNSKLTKEPS